jgi:hypothetical protein
MEVSVIFIAQSIVSREYEVHAFSNFQNSPMVADIQELPSEVDTPTLLHHNNNML